MIELVRTTDPVVVSFIESLLSEAGLSFHVADRHVSAIEGGIGAFPRRILVGSEDLAAARRLLVDAGLAAELAPDPRD